MRTVVLLLLLLLGFGCDKERKPLNQPITVVFSCDTQGRLEPCGCFSGQYGGLSRIRTKINEFQSGLVLKVDAGDAVSGKEDFDLILYKYVQAAYKKMGFHAMNAGVREASLSYDQLNSIDRNAGPPILSANLYNTADKTPVFKQSLTVEENGVKIFITGVVDPELMGERLGRGLEVRNMETSISAVLKNADADMCILLAFCSPQRMKELAGKFFEFNLIVGGAASQPSQKLIKENRSVILYTTNEAKNIGYLNGTLTDKGLEEVDYEIPILTEKVKENGEILQLAINYRKEIRNTKLNADTVDSDTESLIPGVKPQAVYVGSTTCAACHPTSHKQWQNTPHAHAFEALKRRDSDADPKCIKCHTVGFSEPSGYLREFKEMKLTNVGCESCHGPGSEHVSQRSSGLKALFKYRPLGEGDCRECHHGEFSRPFDWEKMWPKIEHGKEKK